MARKAIITGLISASTLGLAFGVLPDYHATILTWGASMIWIWGAQ